MVDNIVLYKDQYVPEETPSEPTASATATPEHSESTPDISGSINSDKGKDNKNNADVEKILIYCAMAACVIAIAVMAVVSAKKK